MQYLLSLFPVLACPVGMGLIMWLMMRMGKEQTSSDAGRQLEERQRAVVPEGRPESSTPLSEPAPSVWKAIWDCMQMCLNWKVLIGLAVVALGVGVAAPRLFLGALPVLLVLACPLSMLFMMGQMGKRQQGAARAGGASCPACQDKPAVETEQSEVIERESTSPVKW